MSLRVRDVGLSKLSDTSSFEGGTESSNICLLTDVKQNSAIFLFINNMILEDLIVKGSRGCNYSGHFV